MSCRIQYPPSFFDNQVLLFPLCSPSTPSSYTYSPFIDVLADLAVYQPEELEQVKKDKDRLSREVSQFEEYNLSHTLTHALRRNIQGNRRLTTAFDDFNSQVDKLKEKQAALELGGGAPATSAVCRIQ